MEKGLLSAERSEALKTLLKRMGQNAADALGYAVSRPNLEGSTRPQGLGR